MANDFGVKVIEVDQIYDAEVDIYSPCAMGSTLNDQTIPKLKCSIVAGSANNQLKDEITHSQMLKKLEDLVLMKLLYLVLQDLLQMHSLYLKD